MATRGLVLAGGGLAGIAWEVGVLVGLREAGIDVRRWDRIVGTSAGSLVGAAAGTQGGLESLLAAPWHASARDLNEYVASLDPDAVAVINELWFGRPDPPDVRTRAEIGRLARAAAGRTADGPRFIDAIGGLLPTRAWPAALVTTAVDAQDGAFVTFDAAAGIELVAAVAASCAVPGVFPPVTIGDRQYIDGGVRSGTCADLAAGLDLVVLVSPARPDERATDRQHLEVAGLRAGGSIVIEIAPDAVALGILDERPMAPEHVEVIIEAGIALGSICGAVVDEATAAATTEARAGARIGATSERSVTDRAPIAQAGDSR